jgi:hypothetical protein
MVAPKSQVSSAASAADAAVSGSNLPTTSASLGATIGAFIVASSMSALTALTTRPDAKSRTERDAALVLLPADVRKAFQTIEAYAVNTERGLASVKSLTIPDGFGIFSGRNGAQVIEQFLSPHASKTDVRKAALNMATKLATA